jgi:hypothetical protein
MAFCVGVLCWRSMLALYVVALCWQCSILLVLDNGISIVDGIVGGYLPPANYRLGAAPRPVKHDTERYRVIKLTIGASCH